MFVRGVFYIVVRELCILYEGVYIVFGLFDYEFE